MTQGEFRIHNSGRSQCECILSVLQRSIGILDGWVAMPRLARESGAYAVHSRISELRKRGHRIEQRSTRLTDGTIASEYRLEPEEETP